MSDITAFPSLAYGPGPDKIMTVGRAVIGAEAEALWALAGSLDHTFDDAVDMLHQTQGRIVVCGLGKSGHIARKVAATLSSTGSPACFLHASEAVHGDLGILQKGDTLLVLSNSGDTRELGPIIPYARRLAIPVIAVTSGLSSRLATSATICLGLPQRPEACPHASAPTTSTAMMLALGDALAVALMRLRNVTIADFQRLHPGGRLGLDLVGVNSFMHRETELPLVAANAPMDEVVHVMTEKGFGVAGVIGEGGVLLGVITDGDLRRHIDDLSSQTAESVMTRTPKTLVDGMLARDALALLSDARITSLFVVDSAKSRRVTGLVHIHDLLRLGIG